MILEEENAEFRRLVIQVIGYARICEELAAIEIDNWREYTLLKIEVAYARAAYAGRDVDLEPIYLLKMTCPSTNYTHVLRVPPNMSSAREAITWVNWGIDPDEFTIET